MFSFRLQSKETILAAPKLNIFLTTVVACTKIKSNVNLLFSFSGKDMKLTRNLRIM